MKLQIAAAMLALLGGCSAHRPTDWRTSPFTLGSWALQNAIGCSGERETRLSDGSVMHELYACAGHYSDARCTVLRSGPDELLVARCTYTFTAGRKVRRQVRHLSCDTPSEDLAKCGADNELWTDGGGRAPAP